MIIPFCGVRPFLSIVVIEPNKSSVPIFALPFTSNVALAVCELIKIQQDDFLEKLTQKFFSNIVKEQFRILYDVHEFWRL